MTQPADFSVSADNTAAPQTLTVLGQTVSPFNDPVSWDSITVGNSQGSFTLANVKIQLRGAKRHFAWQFKKGPGVRGDVNTFRGTHTNSFTLTIWVWTDTQWDQLQQFVSAFNYNDNALNAATGEPNANPVDISYPPLDYLNIHQVLCEWIESPEIDQDHSGWAKCNFGLHEFLPVVPNQNVTNTPIATQVPIIILNRSGGTTGSAITSQTNAINALANDQANPSALQ